MNNPIYKIDNNAEIAKKYVLERPLIRPKTSILCVLIIFISYVAICWILASILINYFNIKRRVLTYFIVYFICFCVISKVLFIQLIKCYQHYAPEHIRRKCLCKPTCSEYAIIVLKKYLTIVALFKIINRLFFTCRGKEYKIDEP